jgi:hypothetical protein
MNEQWRRLWVVIDVTDFVHPKQESGQPGAEAALRGSVATKEYEFRIGGCRLHGL